MSGPWDDYAPLSAAPPAAQPAGPWDNYASPPASDAAPDDQIELSAIPGVFMKGANKIADAVAHAVPFGDRISAAGDTLPGVGTGKSYADNLADQQAQAAQDWKDNPELQIAANVGVGAVPIAKAAQGATYGARALGGLATGGVVGGLYGASGTPDLTDVKQAAIDTGKGAAIGAVVGGGVAPAVGAGAGAVAKYIGGKLAPTVGDYSPKATELLTKAFNGDSTLNQQAAKLGDQANVMDVSPGATGLGQGVTQKLGTASGDMTQPLAERAGQTNTRVNADVDAALGPAPLSADIAQKAVTAQKAPISAAMPLIYRGAPADLDIQPVIDSIDQATANGATPRGLPVTQGLAAVRHSLTEAGAPIAPPTVTPLSNNPTVAEYKTYQAEQAALDAHNANPPPIPQVPIRNAQGIHRVIQDIDKDINWNGQGASPLGGAAQSDPVVFKGIRNQLSDALKDQVPGYDAAMEGLSSLNNQAEAIGNGTKVLGAGRSATNPNDFANDFGPVQTGPQGRMLTPNQRATATGMRASIDDAVGTQPNDFSALRGMLQGTPDDGSNIGAGFNSRNIGHAFGSDAETALQNTVGREKAFANTNNAISGNSLTAQRLAMAAELDKATANTPLISGEVHNVHGWDGAALAAGKYVINKMAAPFQGHVDAPKLYGELTKALTAIGPDRAKMIADVLQNGANAAKTRAMSQAVARAGMLATGLSGFGAARGAQQ